MATTTTQEPLAGHDQDPIVRDKLYIGGEWVAPSGSGTLEVIDSTTEQVMGSVPEGTAEDLDRAVAAAREAFDAWSQVPLDERVAA
ncbi:MAG TPA: aldehyde dehydrogenase family protein, partial [Thermoleophilaceae bacterium]